MANKTCWIDGCNGTVESWGMCGSHRQAWDRLVRVKRTRIEGDSNRFEHYIVRNPGAAIQETFGARPDCMIWGGGLNAYGYGQFRSDWSKTDGGSVFTHLYAWVMVAGKVRGDGLETDHLCRFRPCANPDHLEQVPQLVNNMRGESEPAKNARKTHCDEGHEFTPENTFVNSEGWRDCRECSRARNREFTSRPEVKQARLEKYVPSTGVRGKGQYQSARDTCGEGHKLEGENLVQEKRTRNGKVSYVRRCRICLNRKAANRYAERTGKK